MAYVFANSNENKDVLALKNAGNVAFQQKHFKEANELFSEAIALDPSNATLLSNRAGALSSLARHDEALVDAEECCRLQPGWWKAHQRRGHALFHLKRYQESECAFLEALRLNPNEKAVVDALAQARASMLSAAAGPRAAASYSNAPAVAPTTGAMPSMGATATGVAATAPTGVAGQVPSQGNANQTRNLDFRRLSSDELKARIEEAASKLSDEALTKELRIAGIPVPKGATREDKIKLYVQIDDPKVTTAKAKPAPKKASKDSDTKEGDKFLERRRKWLEEWNSWSNERIVKRLERLGIDGEGLSRDQLLDELLQAETEYDAKRCDPQRWQKLALISVLGIIILAFVGIVLAIILAGS